MGAEVRNAISQAIGDNRYIQLDGSNTATKFNTPYQQTVTVAKSGADYTLIQDAIDSISDAAANKPYVVLIYPGTYTEDITMKAWVSLRGMGEFSQVIISGTDSAPLIDFDNGNSVTSIENLTMSLTPTVTNQIVVQITNGVKFIKGCDIKMVSSTNGIVGQLITCANGYFTINNTRLVYTLSGTAAGANTHNIVEIAGTTSYVFQNSSYFDIDVSDTNDTVNVINDSSTTTSQCFILNCYADINLLSATYSGTTRFYYVTGSGTRVIQGNHVDIDSSGNGTGDIYVLDNASLTYFSTSNHLHVQNFTLNYLGVFLNAGSTINSHFDDIVAADATTGAGTYLYANSPIDGEFWCETILTNTIYGGTQSGDSIDIYGSTHSSLGTVSCFSPIDVKLGTIVPALINPAYAFRDLDNFTTPGGAVVMGTIQSNKTLTVNTGIWFCSQIADQSVYTMTTAPIFSAFTLFNAFPTMDNNGYSGNTNITPSLGMQVAVTHENYYNTATTSGDIGWSWRPTAKQSLAGGSMTCTYARGVSVSPAFDSVVGSSSGFTYVNCFEMLDATVTAMAGTQIFGEYNGLYVSTVVNKLAGTVVSGVRSILAAGANNYCINETGGAQSLFTGNMGFYGTAPVAQQASGANLTNNVAVGGVNDTIANFTDLAVYANDAATIRNDIYQLARKLKQVNDALRAYGLLT